MPIYEYECNDCKCVFEEWAKIKDAPAVVCQKCAGTNINRLISHSGFQLKGNGWYSTGYDKKPKENKNLPKT